MEVPYFFLVWMCNLEFPVLSGCSQSVSSILVAYLIYVNVKIIIDGFVFERENDENT